MSNMTVNSCIGFGKVMQRYTQPGLNIGCYKELAHTHSCDLEKITADKVASLLSECYQDFSTTSDGTPSFEKVEAIEFRGVKKKSLEVVTILLSLRLFKKSLNGDQLTVNMIAVLEKFGLLFKHYRAAMLDRASTNKKCIDLVESGTDSTVTRAYCTSHSLNKPGAAMYNATVVAKKATTVQLQKAQVANEKREALNTYRENNGATRHSSRQGAGNRMILGSQTMLAKLTSDKLEALDELDEINTRLKTYQDDLKDKKEIYKIWKDTITLWNEDDFFQYARHKIIAPGLLKYKKLFDLKTGDHYEMKKAMYAVRVFNPFFIQQNSIATLTLLVHELRHFGKGFPEFSDDTFKSLLISQLTSLKAMSQVTFDWKAMECSKQYQVRKMRKKTA